MCLAIPGRIKKIDGRKVMVSYPNETRLAMLGTENLKAGDYVMVQMGIVVKKLTLKEARASLKAWEELK